MKRYGDALQENTRTHIQQPGGKFWMITRGTLFSELGGLLGDEFNDSPGVSIFINHHIRPKNIMAFITDGHRTRDPLTDRVLDPQDCTEANRG